MDIIHIALNTTKPMIFYWHDNSPEIIRIEWIDLGGGVVGKACWHVGDTFEAKEGMIVDWATIEMEKDPTMASKQLILVAGKIA